ncbi:hypothetical protein [Longimicrobium sp.]|uniref:hypothetical protein n=1 Tax=Longimicrobium sp. TaxID=2029185 RepID=UPI003B3BBB3B
MNAHSHRSTRIRLALGALLAAAALFFSPKLVQQIYAQDPPSCSVNCANGSCSGTGNCTCTCTFWTRTASCSCSSGPPAEQ